MLKKGVGLKAIEDSMVKGEGNVGHGADLDRLLATIFNDNWSFFEFPNRNPLKDRICYESGP